MAIHNSNTSNTLFHSSTNVELCTPFSVLYYFLTVVSFSRLKDLERVLQTSNHLFCRTSLVIQDDFIIVS